MNAPRIWIQISFQHWAEVLRKTLQNLLQLALQMEPSLRTDGQCVAFGQSGVQLFPQAQDHVHHFYFPFPSQPRRDILKWNTETIESQFRLRKEDKKNQPIGWALPTGALGAFWWPLGVSVGTKNQNWAWKGSVDRGRSSRLWRPSSAEDRSAPHWQETLLPWTDSKRERPDGEIKKIKIKNVICF